MCSHYDETFTHNGKHIEYKEWEPIYNMFAKKRIKFIKKWQVQNPRSKNVCNSENPKSTTWVGLRRSRPGWNMEPNHSCQGQWNPLEYRWNCVCPLPLILKNKRLFRNCLATNLNSSGSKNWPTQMWGYLMFLFISFKIKIFEFNCRNIIFFIIGNHPRLH